jgi:hypothetical protein
MNPCIAIIAPVLLGRGSDSENRSASFVTDLDGFGVKWFAFSDDRGVSETQDRIMSMTEGRYAFTDYGT